MSMSVSIVVPVFNENENIDQLVQRVVTAAEPLENEWELVLVDDGSRDGSTEKLEAASVRHDGRIRAIVLNRNYGQHAAIMCGFRHARGDMVITLDADLQNPPEEIPRLVEEIEQGNDVVGTIRMNRQDSFFRRFASARINWMVKKSTGVGMSDYGCMLRAYRRPVVEAMLQCRERSTFIPVLANSFAKRAAEIEVTHAERAAGESKYSLWKLVNLQFDLLTSMTTTPLRLLSWFGVAIAAGGFLFGILLLVGRLLFGAEWAAEGVFTLFAILFIFVGAQFVAMGLLGEYLGRVYHDVRGRPRYFIDHIAGTSMLDGAEAKETARAAALERQVQA
ncbi:MAG: glycosyltransferase [Phycisphaerales bacterium]|nr:glycosyltransferase [Phycisphaerales bacterium]